MVIIMIMMMKTTMTKIQIVNTDATGTTSLDELLDRPGRTGPKLHLLFNVQTVNNLIITLHQEK